MRYTGNLLIEPGTFVRVKKVSAFKTISFLISPPENEPAATVSDHQSRDECDSANKHSPLKSRHSGGEYEVDLRDQERPAVLNDEQGILMKERTTDVTLNPASYALKRERSIPVGSPPGNSSRDTPHEKNDTVDYPGRFALYFRQFPPDHLQRTHKTPKRCEP